MSLHYNHVGVTVCSTPKDGLQAVDEKIQSARRMQLAVQGIGAN
jgi:hypothetical protein